MIKNKFLKAAKVSNKDKINFQLLLVFFFAATVAVAKHIALKRDSQATFITKQSPVDSPTLMQKDKETQRFSN